MAWLDVFAQDVCVIAAKTDDLLCKPEVCAIHQLSMTAIPQLIATRQRPFHATAGRLDGVGTDRLCLARRQLAVPIDDC